MAGLAGTASAIGIIIWLHPPAILATVLLLTGCAVPMWWLEAKRHGHSHSRRHRGTQLRNIKRNLRRIGLIGLMILGAASLQLQRSLAPEWISGLYDFVLPLLVVALIWIIWYLARPLRQAELDTIESLGLVFHRLIGRKRLRHQDRTTLLGWLVKAFFLPLMLAWTHVWASSAWLASDGYRSLASLFVIAMALLYVVDTAFGTIGYLSTSRRIGAQIQSVDATWLGWLSALVCYPPLSVLVLHQWLVYKDGYEWNAWLAGHVWASAAWGGTILLLTGIYTWSTVVFGPRFSNLTHRGIITSGPFRYTKHPAYISKNLSWWMISVPFVSNAGTTVALTHCLALLGVNAIYWVRAKTEERHLMHDPVYRDYAAWIARHGVFARLMRAGRAS